METKATLKAGDVCRDCQELGLVKYLRYFKINLNGDTLLKCESNQCLFPYNDEISSSDEEEKTASNITETSSLNFINDFIQQCSNDEKVQNTNDDFQIKENVSEDVVQFDITFLDDINEIETVNLCKPEISEEKEQIYDNKCNVEVIENKYVPLPTSYHVEYEIPSLRNNNGGINYEISSLNDTLKDCKRKIDIQSIETIKFETPLDDNFPRLSKTFTSKSPNSPKTSPVPEITILTSIETESNSLKCSSTSRKSLPKSKRTLKTSNSTSTAIPKADIIKGNALLKKLAQINETPSISIRKSSHNKKTAKSDEIENPKELIPSSSTDVDYSLDKVSEILLINKINRDRKK